MDPTAQDLDSRRVQAHDCPTQGGVGVPHHLARVGGHDGGRNQGGRGDREGVRVPQVRHQTDGEDPGGSVSQPRAGPLPQLPGAGHLQQEAAHAAVCVPGKQDAGQLPRADEGHHGARPAGHICPQEDGGRL